MKKDYLFKWVTKDRSIKSHLPHQIDHDFVDDVLKLLAEMRMDLISQVEHCY